MSTLGLGLAITAALEIWFGADRESVPSYVSTAVITFRDPDPAGVHRHGRGRRGADPRARPGRRRDDLGLVLRALINAAPGRATLLGIRPAKSSSPRIRWPAPARRPATSSPRSPRRRCSSATTSPSSASPPSAATAFQGAIVGEVIVGQIVGLTRRRYGSTPPSPSRSCSRPAGRARRAADQAVRRPAGSARPGGRSDDGHHPRRRLPVGPALHPGRPGPGRRCRSTRPTTSTGCS